MKKKKQKNRTIKSFKKTAATGDRTWDLQIFSLTLSQLSYIGEDSAGITNLDTKLFLYYKPKTKIFLEGLEPPIF